MYYACFYAVIALLASIELYPKTHNGAKQMFGDNFIVIGIFERECAIFYTKICIMRQQGDYDVFIDYEEVTVMALIEPASNLIALIDVFLEMNESKK